MSISLTASDRDTVFSMSNALVLANKIQEHLNTGYKINQAQDDPNKYFTAVGLRNVADDFSALKDDMAQASKTVETAINGLEKIKTLLDNMQGQISAARQTTDQTTRNNLSRTYTTLIAQIDGIANDTSYNGRNLIETSGATFNLSVIFGIDSGNLSSYTITATGNDRTGLSLATYGGATYASWNTVTDLDQAQAEVDNALTLVRARIQAFGTSLSVINTRLDFTSKHVKINRDGADQLTLADPNEEAAMLKAVQLRQYFGISNLNFSSQLGQGVLRLLG